MERERDRPRCLDRLERLGRSGLDRDTVRQEAIDELRRVIAFDRWCWPLADPETLIPLGALAEHNYGSAVPRALELEYSGRDVAAMDALARSEFPAASLSKETNGDLARSPRWDEAFRAAGIGDEAVAACRDMTGCWGWIKIYRDQADRPFSADDLNLLARVGSRLSRSLHLEVAAPSRPNVTPPTTPGVILLTAELQVTAMTASARAWIDDMPAADLYARFRMLPAMIYPIAARARSRVPGANALERATSGRWVMIEASPLDGRDDREIAVTLRAATAEESFGRLSRIYALSVREREVVAAVVAGFDTRNIAQRLHISRYTVQDHLKSVFRKVGVNSRRELLTTFDGNYDAQPDEVWT